MISVKIWIFCITFKSQYEFLVQLIINVNKKRKPDKINFFWPVCDLWLLKNLSQWKQIDACFHVRTVFGRPCLILHLRPAAGQAKPSRTRRTGVTADSSTHERELCSCMLAQTCKCRTHFLRQMNNCKNANVSLFCSEIMISVVKIKSFL